MDGFRELLDLPGSPAEGIWIEDRLSTLTAKESIILAASTVAPPKTAADAINILLSLGEYEVCYPVISYESLGKFYLDHESTIPRSAHSLIDLDRLGGWYEDQHPGLFVGNAYVQYPAKTCQPWYDGTNLDRCVDDGWSVKVKLGSPTHPEGVWLRLPDYQDINDGRPDEIALALRELEVTSIQDCSILAAQCILPEAGDLMEQYTSPADLIYDGNELGIMLDERGQGMADFEAKVAAALQYEDCRTLAFALEIIQNLGCYDYQPCEHFREIAIRDLTGRGVPMSLIDSGCIDLEEYALDLLDEKGYVMTADEGAFIGRNSREFIYEHSSPKQTGQAMS